MRREDPVLISLRQADCVLSIANRVGGPRRIGSALGGGSGGRAIELDEQRIEDAIAQLNAVRLIADADVRRLVVVAVDTEGCTCDLPIREIARRAGVPASTARRRLRQGLDIIRAAFDEIERKAA